MNQVPRNFKTKCQYLVLLFLSIFRKNNTSQKNQQIFLIGHLQGYKNIKTMKNRRNEQEQDDKLREIN